MSCGGGCRRGLDLALLWLWHRPAAVAPIRPQEHPSLWTSISPECSPKKGKKKKKFLLLEYPEHPSFWIQIRLKFIFMLSLSIEICMGRVELHENLWAWVQKTGTEDYASLLRFCVILVHDNIFLCISLPDNGDNISTSWGYCKGQIRLWLWEWFVNSEV